MPLDGCGRSSDDFDCDPTGGVGDVGPEADGSPPPQPATAIPAAPSTGTRLAIRGVIVRVLMCRKPH